LQISTFGLWPPLLALRKKLHRFCTIFAPEKVFYGLPSLPHKVLSMHCAGLVQFGPAIYLTVRNRILVKKR